MNKIIIYGADWCGDCFRAKAVFDSHNISYEYINIDNDQKALEEVLKMNNGRNRIPVIKFPNGEILIEPSTQELEEKLTLLNL